MEEKVNSVLRERLADSIIRLATNVKESESDSENIDCLNSILVSVNKLLELYGE